MKTKINLLLAGLLVTGGWACKGPDSGTATISPVPKMPGLFMVNTQVMSIPAEEREAVKLVSQFNFPQDVFKLDPSQLSDSDVQAIKSFLEENGASDKIQIHGYASPEGPYQRNAMLASNRAQVVKKILTEKLNAAGFEGSLEDRVTISVNTTTEDWKGFTALVDKSSVNNKSDVLIVAQSNNSPEVKEKQMIKAAGSLAALEPSLAPLRRTTVVIPCKVVCIAPNEVDSMAVAYMEGRINNETLKEAYTQEELLSLAQATNAPAGKKSLLVAYYDIYPNDYRAFNELGLASLRELKVEDDEFKAEGDGWELKVEDDEMKYKDKGGQVKVEDDQFTLQKDGSKLKTEDDEIKLKEGTAKAKIENDEFKVKDYAYKLKVDADGEVQLEDGFETIKMEVDGRKYENEYNGVKVKNEDDFKIKDRETGLKLKIKDGKMTVRENGEVYRFEEIAGNPQAQEFLSRYDDALQQFERANELRNNDNIVLSNLGAVHISKQNLTEAKGHLTTSLSIRETPEAHYNLGLVNALDGDYTAALEHFNKAGNAPQYIYNRGLTKLLLGDLNGAEDDLKSFLIEYPNEAVAYYVLAVTGARMNDASLVSSSLQKACALDDSLAERAVNDSEFEGFDISAFTNIAGNE